MSKIKKREEKTQMSLIEKISEKEMEMIGSYVDAYALGEAERTASTEYLLREWKNAKAGLAEMFGGELILSREINVIKDIGAIEHDMRKMVRQNEGYVSHESFIKRWHKFENELWEMYALGNTTFTREMYDATVSLVWAENLATNIYNGPVFDLKLPSWDKAIKLQKGAKVTRLLNKIAKNFGSEAEYAFERFRIEHSQVLNQKSFHGTLCLSIHPLDFMTMSDNHSDWSSCMSWLNDGCYRQGTVEMMNSANVVVAYLRGAEDMGMPGGFNYTWNNKKWRELFIVDPMMISNVKGYPYMSDDLSKIALDWLVELAGKDKYHSEMTTYQPWNVFSLDGHNYLVDPQTNNMYNDFSEDRDQFAYFSNDLPNNDTNNNYYSLYIIYSGASECMACGALDCYFESEGFLIGECCDNICSCSNCGNHIYSEEEMYTVDGNVLCRDCFENECSIDPIDDDYHMNYDMKFICLATDTKLMQYDMIGIYRPNFDDEILSKYFTKIHHAVIHYHEYLYVKASECTPAGLRLFEYQTVEEVDDISQQYYISTLNLPTEEIEQEDTLISHTAGCGYNWYYNLES